MQEREWEEHDEQERDEREWEQEQGLEHDEHDEDELVVRCVHLALPPFVLLLVVV